MKPNYNIKPGQDKFLQLHIDDLSKLTLNETKRGSNIDRNLTPVVVSATITGFIFGIIAAYLIGILP
jgi:hypothetical protein